MSTVEKQGRPAAAVTVCPPSPAQLTPTAALTLGTLDGWDAGVTGLAVDDRYVYATHGYAGKQNRHDSPAPGELFVFDRAEFAAAVATGTQPQPVRVPVGWQPRSVASLVRPDYQRVFVVNYHQNSYSVTMVDRDTWHVHPAIPIGVVPIDVAVHTGRGRAYVTNGYHGIWVIDAATGALLPGEKMPLDREVHGLAVDEASDTLFVTRMRHYGAGAPIDELLVIDLATRTVAETIALPPRSGPVEVAHDAATGLVYVATIGTVDGVCAVFVVDPATPSAPPVRIPTSAGVLSVALGRTDPAGPTYCYAAAGGRLDVLDTVRRERVGSVTLARQTVGVAVDPATGEVYVGDNYDGRLFRVAPLVQGSPVGQLPQVGDGSLGTPLGAPRPTPDGEGVMQPFQHGHAVATADYGAVAISPAHATAWLATTTAPAGATASTASTGAGARALPSDPPPYLGNPVGDTKTVGGVQASYFEYGMIVSTTIDGQPADVIVHGPIWERYREGGDVGGGYGRPVTHETVTAKGSRFQHFERASIFHRAHTGAHVVWHGTVYDAWRDHYGGSGGFFGYPVADLHREYHEEFGVLLIEWLELENGTLVWNGVTDTVHFLTGEFRRAWQAEGGAHGGRLGLPVSNPQGSPHDENSPVRFVEFERGMLVWFPPGEHRLGLPDDGCHVVTSLELFVKGFKALEWDQGNPDNPPDLYVRHFVAARRGDAEPFMRWDGTLPGDDDWWQDTTQVTLDLPVPVTDLLRGDTILDVILIGRDDDDDLDGDDTLGRFDLTYTVDNLWGMRDAEEHHVKTDEGEFFAYYYLKPKDVATDLDGNFRGRFFWKFDNFDTVTMTPEVYGRTFSDIEPGVQFHLNPLAYLDEGWESFFYHRIYNGVGKKGNCFGMAVEAIAAFKHRSPFPQPIFELGNPQEDLPGDLQGDPHPEHDRELIKQINIKHGYQLGAPAVRWIAKHIAKGTATHGGTINDGRRVFEESREAMRKGDWPVLNMVRHWKFSAHTVLPIKWVVPEEEVPPRPASDPLEIWLADPARRPLPPEAPDTADDAYKILISRIDGRWRYRGSYNSDEPRWLFWMPYSLVRDQPRSPSWEVLATVAAALFVIGSTSTVFILSGDADTHQLSDGGGRTLYVPGLGRAPQSPLDVRADPDGAIPEVYRLPLFGADDAPVDGELHLAMGRHDTLSHDVVGRPGGTAYDWGMRTAAMAAIVTAPTDTVADRIHAEHLGSARRAVSFARPKNAPAKPIKLMLEATPRGPMPREHVLRQFLLSDLEVGGGQRVVARLDDGGRDLLLSSYNGDAAFDLRLRGEPGTELSRSRRLTVPRGHTLRLRPTDWTPAGLDSAPVRVEVREHPDGPPVQCYESLPDGPPES